MSAIDVTLPISMPPHVIEVQLIGDGGHPPCRMTDEAAGYDIYANDSGFVRVGEHTLIKLGFKIRLPRGTYGQLYMRSSLAYKHGLVVLGGVIDSDYSGEVGLLVYNTKGEHFRYNKGDRIAQLVVHMIQQLPVNVVTSFSDEVVINTTIVPTIASLDASTFYNHHTELPAELPVETPVETPTETPVETPTETPVESPTETPVETPVESPAETPVETPAELPTEASIESHVEVKNVSSLIDALTNSLETAHVPAKKASTRGKKRTPTGFAGTTGV